MVSSTVSVNVRASLRDGLRIVPVLVLGSGSALVLVLAVVYVYV